MAGVTLKDIAKECGISFSAVSKALKGSSEISLDTIKLVTETAQRMGYSPNSAARALRTNRSYDIGVIFEDSTGSGLQHQYFAKIFDAINVVANVAGYDITFLNSKEKRDYLAQAKYRGCDGIAIVSTKFNRQDIVSLLSSELPTCTLDYSFSKNHNSVLSDNFSGMKTLTEYAVAQGHKKIAFIHGEMSDVSKERIASFMQTLETNGITPDSSLIVPGVFHDTDSSAQATVRLLSQTEKPTCIFYPDDYACMGGIRVLSEYGMIPGRDISIAGYDGTMLAELVTPKLTTYEQNAREIGAQMVKLLLNQIENPKTFEPTSVSVSGRLIHGQSIASIG